MLDALTPSLTLSLYEDHICPHCENVVPKKVLNVLGIIKTIQPFCRCEVQAYESGTQEAIELKQKRDIESRFSISNLGERFTESTFEAFKPLDGTEKAIEHCRNYANTFPMYGADSLMIWGEPGNGKSHLAAAVAHTVQSKGHTIVFQTMPELLERIRQTFNDRSNKETERDIMRALHDCELLVLDDVGAEKLSDWVQDVLFRIVDGRYRQKRPIFYTTNLKPSDLKEKVGPRIYDRMIETSLTIQNTGTSYRMKVAEKRYREMNKGTA